MPGTICSLERHERLCGRCEDGFLGHNIFRQWCFSLRIEIEPKDCNIDRDAVEPTRAFWVGIVEKENKTVGDLIRA